MKFFVKAYEIVVQVFSVLEEGVFYFAALLGLSAAGLVGLILASDAGSPLAISVRDGLEQRSGIKLSSDAASVDVSAPRNPQASESNYKAAASSKTASTGADSSPQSLSWRLGEKRDAMTDVVTRQAESQIIYADGNSLSAETACDAIGIGFTFYTFRGQSARPLASVDGKIQMRVRTDADEVRILSVAQEYSNEAKIEFYDPTAVKRIAKSAYESSVPKLQVQPGDSKARQGAAQLSGAITDLFGGTAVNSTLAEVDAEAAGVLSRLVNSRSVRVELVYEDGTSNIVDINPQDLVLKNFVSQCFSGFQTKIDAEQNAAVARDAAEQASKAKTQLEKRVAWDRQLDQSAISDKDASIIVLRKTEILCLVKQQTGEYRWQKTCGVFWACSLQHIYNAATIETQRRFRDARFNQSIDELRPYIAKIPDGYLRIMNNGPPVLVKKIDVAPSPSDGANCDPSTNKQ